jgi:hypothetical protein
LRGKTLGSLVPDVWFRTGRYITVKFTCPLRAGKYKFVVTGRDGASNKASKSPWNYIVVSAARRTVGAALAARTAPGTVHFEPAGVRDCDRGPIRASIGLKPGYCAPAM